MYRNKKFLIGVVIVFVFVLIGVSTASTRKQSESTEVAQTASPTPAKEQSSYETLGTQTEPYLVTGILVNAGDSGAESYAQKVKNGCSKPCNVVVYDDRTAYSLQSEYDRLSAQETIDPSALSQKTKALKDWQAKNYVFVADHTVGMIDVSTNQYQAYPYRDNTYRQLKAK